MAVPTLNRRESVHVEFLQSIPLALVVNHEKPMLFVKQSATLEEALSALCQNGTQDGGTDALPVLNDEDGTYEYCCSRLDIISMLAWSKSASDWKSAPLTDVLHSDDDAHVVSPKIFSFSMDDAVVACLEYFSKGVHHILVTNEEYEEPADEAKADAASGDDEDSDTVKEQKYYWVSQWDIIEYLHLNIHRMSAVVDAPIDKIGLVKKREIEKDRDSIVTVPCTMLAREAFKKFLTQKCDVIAIMDKDKLVSSVSETDIVGVGPEATSFLLGDEYLTIKDFMDAVNKENDRDCEPVTCRLGDALRNLLAIAVEKKTNHIFVVDEQQAPLKIVMLRDLICKFSPYDFKTNRASKRLRGSVSGMKCEDLLTVLEEAEFDSSSVYEESV